MNIEELFQELPPVIYQQTLHLLATSAREDHFHMIVIPLVQNVLMHLDPDHHGVVLSILQCTPPLETRIVRSLYSRLTLGTSPWTGGVVQQILFFGAESLASRVIITSRAALIAEMSKEERLPFVPTEGARSLACTPIQRFGRTAGVLAVASTIPLSQAQSTLLQEAAVLLGLVIPEEDLYALHQFDIQMMPPAQTQLKALSTYRHRLLKVTTLARESGHPFSIAQAERIVLHQFETIFLRLAASEKERSLADMQVCG